jgi:hypothetical protein
MDYGDAGGDMVHWMLSGLDLENFDGNKGVCF